MNQNDPRRPKRDADMTKIPGAEAAPDLAEAPIMVESTPDPNPPEEAPEEDPDAVTDEVD